MQPWTIKTLTLATLVIIMEIFAEIDTSPTTRQPQKSEHKGKKVTSHEETPEEIYNRLMGIKEANEAKDKEKDHVEHIQESHNEAAHHNDDEYTYEYKTVEDEAHKESIPSTTHHDKIGTRKLRKHAKDHSGISGHVRKTRKRLYTMDSKVVDTLQKKERKGDMTSRDRELAKRNLLRAKSSTGHWKHSGHEGGDYVNADGFDKIKARERGNGGGDGTASVNGTAVGKKEYTYEYETVERNDKGGDYGRLGLHDGGEYGGRGHDDEYTYEYETVENKTKGEEEMTSKELFDKQLAEYHSKFNVRRAQGKNNECPLFFSNFEILRF